MTNILLIFAPEVITFNILSPETIRLCKRTFTEWHECNYDTLVISGGTSVSEQNSDQPISESMMDWFVDHGVPSERIICEIRSELLHEQIAYSEGIIERMGPCRVTLISYNPNCLQSWLSFLIDQKRLIKKMIVVKQPGIRWNNSIRNFKKAISAQIKPRPQRSLVKAALDSRQEMRQ